MGIHEGRSGYLYLLQEYLCPVVGQVTRNLADEAVDYPGLLQLTGRPTSGSQKMRRLFPVKGWQILSIAPKPGRHRMQSINQSKFN